MLFCVYIDGLLSAVSAAKVGCSIGTMFTGILAYADDIALLAPTAYHHLFATKTTEQDNSICNKAGTEMQILKSTLISDL